MIEILGLKKSYNLTSVWI